MSGLAKLCGGQAHKCVLGRLSAATRRGQKVPEFLYKSLFCIAIPFNRIVPGLLTMIYSLWSLFLDFTFPEKFTLWRRKKKSRHNFMVLYFVTP